MTGHRVHIRSGISLAVGLVLLSGCTSNRPAPAHRDAAVPALRLVAFDSCADLLTGLRAAAKESVGPYGFNSGSEILPFEKGAVADSARAPEAVPGAATPDHSTTNTHEAGVDEPDLVKTDGRRIVTVTGGTLRVVDAASRKVTGSLSLGSNGSDQNLLLAGDHALVLIRGGWGAPATDAPATGTPATGARATDIYPAPAQLSRLLLVDLTGNPRVLSQYTIDGDLLDARQIGSVARVVIHSTPHLPFRTDGDRTTDQRLADNRALIDSAPADQWLPRYAVESSGRKTTGQVGCGAVSRPATYSGAAMLTVLTFDVAAAALGTGDPTTLVADGDTVYSNGPSLYIATDERWRAWPMLRVGRSAIHLDGHTQLYRFDISGAGKPRYVAGGDVPGWLINQYAMSEWDGKLRVATTLGQPWDQTTKAESSVYVLDDALHEIGHVGGLGRGERIYAVRFVGPTGYVVTFRQTDPLYVVDLRRPTSPSVAGELKINGYSSYLFPAGDGRLIGLGRSADDSGRTTGLQVSSFDVSDPAKPTRLAQYTVPGAYTEAEYDPHAFLYWPATGLLVVPVMNPPTPNGDVAVSDALALRMSGTSITSVGSVAGPRGQQIRRSLMIGDVLWTVSDQTVAAYSAGTLAKLAEL